MQGLPETRASGQEQMAQTKPPRGTRWSYVYDVYFRSPRGWRAAQIKWGLWNHTLWPELKSIDLPSEFNRWALAALNRNTNLTHLPYSWAHSQTREGLLVLRANAQLPGWEAEFFSTQMLMFSALGLFLSSSTDGSVSTDFFCSFHCSRCGILGHCP